MVVPHWKHMGASSWGWRAMMAGGASPGGVEVASCGSVLGSSWTTCSSTPGSVGWVRSPLVRIPSSERSPKGR